MPDGRQSFQFVVTVDVDPEPGFTIAKAEARRMAREVLDYVTGCDLPRSKHSYIATSEATATVASVRAAKATDAPPGILAVATAADRQRLSDAVKEAIGTCSAGRSRPTSSRAR
jgi:hypothetical protein